MRRVWMVVGLVLGVTLGLPAQEREDRTLLTQGQMNAIINEASGERALHHVMELVPYQFVRPPSEYQGHFRESDALARMAREDRLQQRRHRGFPDRANLAAPRRRAVDHRPRHAEAVRHP